VKKSYSQNHALKTLTGLDTGLVPGCGKLKMKDVELNTEARKIGPVKSFKYNISY